jgi:hypothetical protein
MKNKYFVKQFEDDAYLLLMSPALKYSLIAESPKGLLIFEIFLAKEFEILLAYFLSG